MQQCYGAPCGPSSYEAWPSGLESLNCQEGHDMLSLLAAESQPPLLDRLLVAAVGPLVTVLIGGLVVWGVTSTVQRKREETDRTRDEERADSVRAEDRRSKDDALRQDLVWTMTEAA